VLRVDQDPATSPQTPGSPFACDGCPPSGPHRYFLFPRTELNALSEFAYNHLHPIRVHGDEIEVELAEFHNCMSIYRFSADLTPLTVSVSDSYPEVHRRLEREGKIKHSYAECPERLHPKKIRVWEPQSGWRDLLVPWSEPR